MKHNFATFAICMVLGKFVLCLFMHIMLSGDMPCYGHSPSHSKLKACRDVRVRLRLLRGTNDIHLGFYFPYYNDFFPYLSPPRPIFLFCM